MSLLPGAVTPEGLIDLEITELHGRCHPWQGVRETAIVNSSCCIDHPTNRGKNHLAFSHWR